MKITYAHYSFDVDNLGPGLRHVLWVQGCCFRCDGCIASSYHDRKGTETEASELAEEFLYRASPHIEGITVSGGEPFLQAEGLLEFVRILKKQRDWGVICYTGFTMEELREREKSDPYVGALLEEMDMLIDGRYIRELDKGDALRGSSNQRIWCLTDRYRDQIETVYGSKNRQMTVRFEDNKMVMIGVPGEDDRKRWENMKKYLQTVGGELV